MNLAVAVAHKNAYAHIADKYRWCKKKAYTEWYSALYLVKKRTYQAFCNCGKQRHCNEHCFNIFHSVTINVFDLFIKTCQTAENTDGLLIKAKKYDIINIYVHEFFKLPGSSLFDRFV